MFQQGSRKIAVAVVVAACVSSLGGYSIGFHHGQRSRDQQVASLQRLADLWHNIREADNTKWSVNRAMEAQMPMDEFEAKIGQVVKVDPRKLPKGDENMTHVFKDEKTGRIFYLRFADNRLMGYHSGYGFGEVGEFLDLGRHDHSPLTTNH